MRLQTVDAAANEAVIKQIVHNIAKERFEHIWIGCRNILLNALSGELDFFNYSDKDLLPESHFILCVCSLDPLYPDGNVYVQLWIYIAWEWLETEFDWYLALRQQAALLWADLQVVTSVEQPFELELEVELETLRDVR